MKPRDIREKFNEHGIEWTERIEGTVHTFKVENVISISIYSTGKTILLGKKKQKQKFKRILGIE